MSRHRVPVAVLIFLIREGSILLLRRHNTGFADGKYMPLGGHVEAGESLQAAAARECLEEVGIQVEPADFEFVGVTHFRSTRGDGVDFWLKATRWEGEPYSRAECDEVRWCPVDSLPDNTVPFVVKAVEHHLRKGSPFDTLGWESDDAAPRSI